MSGEPLRGDNPVIYLGPNYGGGNKDNRDLVQKIPCMYCYTQCPQPCSRPSPTHASTRDSWTLMGKSGSVCSFLLGPGAQGSVCALQESVSSVLCKFWWLCGGDNGDLQEGLCHTQVCCTQSPCPCGRPPLTHTSTGDAQTQFCLSLCGVPVSWCPQGLFTLSKHLWREWGLILNANSPILPSYWGFSDLGHGVSPHGQSSKAQPPLLTLDMGDLLTVASYDMLWTGLSM